MSSIHSIEELLTDEGFTAEPGPDSDLSPEAMEAAHEASHPAIVGIGANALVGANLLTSDESHTISTAINSARYPSQLRDISKTLTLALARKQITNQEYNFLYEIYTSKKESFEVIKPTSMQHQPAVLESDLDFRERQLPVGDR